MNIIKNKKILYTIFTLFFIIVFGIIIVTKAIFSSLGTDTTIVISIPQNFSVKQIAFSLNSMGVIRNPFLFRVLTRVSGNENNMKAGEYEFKLPSSMWEILKKIRNGEFKKYKITIPEGYTSAEIAELLSNAKIVDKEKFNNLLKDKKLLKKYNINGDSIEGYLFPDTYYLFKNMSEEVLIENILSRFFGVFDENFNARVKEMKLTRHDVIILASIVEKEAQVDNERRIISAVFLNRMKKHIKLESCATVLYALGRHKKRLWEEDLKINSPYNTYIHTGLPKGPISNPGRASIYAVLYPLEVDYLYFVSRNDGTHEFSKTFNEHAKNKRKFRR
ncbi:MAG: endolytic transglycosylase MltG [Candidatus Firestonebacteria bacterium]|nr:endolytic transglycosylase MltG [Candidatus Firestonebacteria bacterium]